MTAGEKILQKALVGSSKLDSRQWNSIQAGLRDRAFFSSQVASVRVLHAAREMVADRAGGNLSESEFRREMRKVLGLDGYDAGENRGTIKDLVTKARLDVIQRTNVEQARGYIHHLEATAPGAFAAFPAQELVRVRQRKQPRDWAKRWQDAGGKLYEGRMIALVDDPIWTAISAFGNPFPPFDFGSGMGVRAVKKSEAVRLGVISADEVRAKAEELRQKPAPDFNANLQATFDAGHWSDEYARKLRDAFGDQLKHTQDQKTGNVTVQWQRCLLRDMFENYTPPTQEESGKGWSLGKATAKLLAECDKVSPKYRQLFEGRGISLNKSIAKHTIDEGHWLVDKTPGNIPVKPADLDLVPSMWRNPDYIEAGGKKDSIVLCLETFDGGILKMPVVVKRQVPTPTGLFKQEAPTSSPANIP